MKRLLIGPLMALALCSTAANASTLATECATVAKIAEKIATTHQSGDVPLAKLLVALDKSDDIMEMAYHAIIEKLAYYIYDFPRFQSEESRQRFIDKTRDLIHAACLVEIHCADCRPEYSPYRY